MNVIAEGILPRKPGPSASGGIVEQPETLSAEAAHLANGMSGNQTLCA